MSHYETLEVHEGASPEEVRRAYLDLARRLHPDRWIDASPEERATAEGRMQEVNEAWRVLGNAGRRIAYDQDRDAPPRPARFAASTSEGASFSTGSLFGDDIAEPSTLAYLLRLLPWLLVVLVLGGIFVFTAYASSPDGAGVRCVALEAGAAPLVDCGTAGARIVVAEVQEVGLCPDGTEPFQPNDRPSAYCLEPRG